MLHSIYVYGHLLTASFSLLMVASFALLARRTGRGDWWNVAAYAGAAASGALSFAEILRPTVFGWRALVALVLALTVLVTASFHAQFAELVWKPARRRAYRRALIAYTVISAGLIGLLLTGLLDEGLRTVAFAGVEVRMLALNPLGYAALFIAAGNFLLSAEILACPGPRKRERWQLFLPLLFAPVVNLYEFGLLAGWFSLGLPLAGYFATIRGLQGVVVIDLRLQDDNRETRPFAGYVLGRRLGAGGMAEVFLARKQSSADDPIKLTREFAIKRMHMGVADDPRFARMFVEEARLIARLRHPHIVSLHDAGMEEGQLYLAMELVDGVALSKIRRLLDEQGGVLPPAVVAEVGVQIADALAYAHALRDERGRPLEIVHRDVSPQNVLIDKAGVAKLADFGIARTSERSQTTTGVFKGKLPYVAPEQLLGKRYDSRVDVYALGVVLFELATGQTPFRADTDAALLFQIAEGRPDLSALADLPPALGDAIRACLASDPGARISSADELRCRLQHARGDLDDGDRRRILGVLAGQAEEAQAAAERESGASIRSLSLDMATVRELPLADQERETERTAATRIGSARPGRGLRSAF